MDKKYKTKWAKEEPPWGYFDDNIIFTKKGDYHFIMRVVEFDFLGRKLYELYEKKEIEYITIVSVWNEAYDFSNSNCIVDDVDLTISALEKLDLDIENNNWGDFSRPDIEKLIFFLRDTKTIEIREE